MARILLFPLSARRVVGTDLYRGALVTIPAAVASYCLLPHLELLNVFYLMLGSTPGDPDRLAGGRRAAGARAPGLAGDRPGRLGAKTLGAI